MSEDTFVRELERRADDVRPRHLGFEDVRTTAYRIRRRRRVAASAARPRQSWPRCCCCPAWSVARRAARARSRPQADDAVPSSSTTPGVSVLHDGILTRPDSSTVPLDVDTADVQQLGVLTDGRVVVAVANSAGSSGSTAPMATLESEHDVAINQITMSADDTLAAWIDENYRVVVLESGVTEPTTFEWGIPMPGEAVGSIDAVYGSDCANDGCTVLGGDFNTTTTTLSLRSEPGIDLATSEPLRVAAVSPDGEQWAVDLPARATASSSGARGSTARRPTSWSRGRAPRRSGQFSPDGTHLTGARGDNSMWGSVEVIQWGEGVDPVLIYEPDDGFTVDDCGLGGRRSTCWSSSPGWTTRRSGHCCGSRSTGASWRRSSGRSTVRTPRAPRRSCCPTERPLGATQVSGARPPGKGLRGPSSESAQAATGCSVAGDAGGAGMGLRGGPSSTGTASRASPARADPGHPGAPRHADRLPVGSAAADPVRRRHDVRRAGRATGRPSRASRRSASARSCRTPAGCWSPTPVGSRAASGWPTSAAASAPSSGRARPAAECRAPTVGRWPG